jgi:hypothetical protein
MEGQDRSRDFVSALIFIALGSISMTMALGYPLGTTHRIGPGALPLIVSALLVAVGIGLAAQCLLRGREAGPLLPLPSLPESRMLRAILFISLSLIVFGLLIRPAGLFLATAALAFTARQAEPGASLLGSIVQAFALAALSTGIFVYGIGLPFRVWP